VDIYRRWIEQLAIDIDIEKEEDESRSPEGRTDPHDHLEVVLQ